MDVAEHVPGEAPGGVLPDLLEDRIAQIVEQHAAEARRGVGEDESGDDGEGRVRAHSVDGKLQRIGTEENHRLARKDQQDGRDHSRLELALAARPQHRQEAPQRSEAAGRLGDRARHRRLR